VAGRFGSNAVYQLKEIYLSVYVLFFRIGGGQWPSHVNADAHKGVAGVAVVEGILLITLVDWIQSIAGNFGIGRWVPGIVGVVIYAINYYFLVIQGNGVAFEKQFGSLPKSKRLTLRLVAVGIFVATLALYFAAHAKSHSDPNS
jgi:hypothetical protein